MLVETPIAWVWSLRATVVATPVFKWVTPLTDTGYTAGLPNYTEPIVDSAGSVYVTDMGPSSVMKVNSAGAFQWRSAKRFGGKIVEERTFQYEPGNRRSDPLRSRLRRPSKVTTLADGGPSGTARTHSR